MTDQENENIKGFLDKAIIYLVGKAKKINLNLDNDNFKNNLKEIVNNPTSEYADNVYLFDKIPNLKKQEEELNKQIKTLKAEVDKFNTEIDGKEGANGLKAIVKELENQQLDLEKKIEGNDESEDENEKRGLEGVVRELEELRDDLEIQLNGKDDEIGLKAELEKLKNEKDILKKEINGDESSEDKLKKDGLLKYKEDLHDQLYRKGGLENKRSNLSSQINHLTKQYSVVENLAELRSDAKKDQKFYYWCVGVMIVLIILSSVFAYNYGNRIINDITKIIDKDSRDYFGMFLMKIPFSLMIITFISGGFIFISKLLVIIERISNQLRNISQISVIAYQIDQKTIDLINCNLGFTKEDDKLLSEEKSKKEEKTLFYNLIADYLVNLSKNELELKEKKGSQLKMLKELASIIHKIKPSQE